MANEDMYKTQNPNVKLQTRSNPLPQFQAQEQSAPPPMPESDNPYMDTSEDDDPYSAVDTIPKTENLLQKAIRKAGSFSEGFMDVETLGGTWAARKGAEALTPLPPEGEQMYQEMTAADPVAKAAGAALPIARGVQQVGKAGINALFGKQMAKKAIPKATGKLSESIQKVIKASEANPQKLGVPKDEVLKVLRDNFSKSKVPHGEQKAVFQRWMNALENSPQFKSKTMLTADDISQLEVQFGKAAKFGKTANDPVLQQGAKEVNRYASARLDLIAEKAGVPEFIKRSTEKSKLIAASKAKPNFLQKAIKTAVTGGILGAGGKVGYDLIK